MYIILDTCSPRIPCTVLRSGAGWINYASLNRLISITSRSSCTTFKSVHEENSSSEPTTVTWKDKQFHGVCGRNMVLLKLSVQCSSYLFNESKFRILDVWSVPRKGTLIEAMLLPSDKKKSLCMYMKTITVKCKPQISILSLHFYLFIYFGADHSSVTFPGCF